MCPQVNLGFSNPVSLPKCNQIMMVTSKFYAKTSNLIKFIVRTSLKHLGKMHGVISGQNDSCSDLPEQQTGHRDGATSEGPGLVPMRPRRELHPVPCWKWLTLNDLHHLAADGPRVNGDVISNHFRGSTSSTPSS